MIGQRWRHTTGSKDLKGDPWAADSKTTAGNELDNGEPQRTGHASHRATRRKEASDRQKQRRVMSKDALGERQRDQAALAKHEGFSALEGGAADDLGAERARSVVLK